MGAEVCRLVMLLLRDESLGDVLRPALAKSAARLVTFAAVLFDTEDCARRDDLGAKNIGTSLMIILSGVFIILSR
jgi:hypothetical protein